MERGSVRPYRQGHKLAGTAKFLDANELQVDDHTKVVAKSIVIAAGSRPAVPAPWYTLEDRLLINDDVFDWDSLPQSIAVVGTGVIGMEISIFEKPRKKVPITLWIHCSVINNIILVDLSIHKNCIIALVFRLPAMGNKSWNPSPPAYFGPYTTADAV